MLQKPFFFLFHITVPHGPAQIGQNGINGNKPIFGAPDKVKPATQPGSKGARQPDSKQGRQAETYYLKEGNGTNFWERNSSWNKTAQICMNGCILGMEHVLMERIIIGTERPGMERFIPRIYTYTYIYIYIYICIFLIGFYTILGNYFMCPYLAFAIANFLVKQLATCSSVRRYASSSRHSTELKTCPRLDQPPQTKSLPRAVVSIGTVKNNA